MVAICPSPEALALPPNAHDPCVRRDRLSEPFHKCIAARGDAFMAPPSARPPGARDGALPDRVPQDRLALDQLFSAAYEELRRLASSVRRRDPSATLSPAALVNEAWLKLAGSPGIGATSRLHFKRIAARAMRQVLIEAARRRNAWQRGAGADLVTFDDGIDETATSSADVLALDAALEGLARLNPRQAAMIESRF